MEWLCQKKVWNFHLIDTPQSPSKWLDHDIRAAISPYFCHHFILRNFYLKGEINVSFLFAFLQLIVRLDSFYIFICTNYFFRLFSHFLLDCFFSLTDLFDLFIYSATHPLSVIVIAVTF